MNQSVRAQLSRVYTSLLNVTADQIGKVSAKCFDFQTKRDFYMVENSRSDVDENGDVIEYRVDWTLERGFTCSCACGQHGFVHAGPSGVCWHVLAAVAAAREEQTAFTIILNEIAQEREAPVLIIAGNPATPAELDRIMNADPRRPGKAKPNNPRAFSVLRESSHGYVA